MGKVPLIRITFHFSPLCLPGLSSQLIPDVWHENHSLSQVIAIPDFHLAHSQEVSQKRVIYTNIEMRIMTSQHSQHSHLSPSKPTPVPQVWVQANSLMFMLEYYLPNLSVSQSFTASLN